MRNFAFNARYFISIVYYQIYFATKRRRRKIKCSIHCVYNENEQKF